MTWNQNRCALRQYFWDGTWIAFRFYQRNLSYVQLRHTHTHKHTQRTERIILCAIFISGIVGMDIFPGLNVYLRRQRSMTASVFVICLIQRNVLTAAVYADYRKIVPFSTHTHTLLCNCVCKLQSSGIDLKLQFQVASTILVIRNNILPYPNANWCFHVVLQHDIDE